MRPSNSTFNNFTTVSHIFRCFSLMHDLQIPMSIWFNHFKIRISKYECHDILMQLHTNSSAFRKSHRNFFLPQYNFFPFPVWSAVFRISTAQLNTWLYSKFGGDERASECICVENENDTDCLFIRIGRLWSDFPYTPAANTPLYVSTMQSMAKPSETCTTNGSTWQWPVCYVERNAIPS